MAYVTGFVYKLEQFTVPGYPGLVIEDGCLDISIERLNGELDWYVDSVQLDKADGTVEFFYAKSFLYDAIVPHLYKDRKFSQNIMDEAREMI